QAADERAGDVADQTDPEQHEAAVEVAVALVDQKWTLQRLDELVTQLVKEDEGEDFERPVPCKEAEKGIPDGLLDRSRRDGDARRLRSPDGDQQHRQVEAGEEDVDRRPAIPSGEGDRKAARELHAGAIQHVARPYRNGLFVRLQHVHRVGIDGYVLRGAGEGEGQRQGEEHPGGVRLVAEPRQGDGRASAARSGPSTATTGSGTSTAPAPG